MISLSDALQLVSVALIAMSGVLTLVSLVYFQSSTVKLVCLEVLANLLLSALAFWAWFMRQSLLIDVALAVALIMFLSTVAYCQFIVHRETGHD